MLEKSYDFFSIDSPSRTPCENLPENYNKTICSNSFIKIKKEKKCLFHVFIAFTFKFAARLFNSIRFDLDSFSLVWLRFATHSTRIYVQWYLPCVSIMSTCTTQSTMFVEYSLIDRLIWIIASSSLSVSTSFLPVLHEIYYINRRAHFDNSSTDQKFDLHVKFRELTTCIICMNWYYINMLWCELAPCSQIITF